MAMAWIDWTILGAMLVSLVAIATYCQRQVKSVADFLVAGRSAGRYLLTVGFGMVWVGAVNIVAMFELYHSAGLVAMWWALLMTPFAIYLAISGFGVYRYRDTRAMTIAQFLEMRYSRTVRVMSGCIAWAVGMMVFGIFPAVGARLMIQLTGLPAEFEMLGINCATHLVMMAGLIGVSLIFVFIGGHLTVLVTDFFQGTVAAIAGLAIIIFIGAAVINWTEVTTSLTAANDRRSLASGSAPITTAGLDLLQNETASTADNPAMHRAGVNLVLAGNLLESLDSRRPSGLATKEIVGRMLREASDPAAMAAVIASIAEGLVQRDDIEGHRKAALHYQKYILLGLHDSTTKDQSPMRDAGIEDDALTPAFPRGPNNLRYLASVLLMNAADDLKEVDPRAAEAIDLLTIAAKVLPGDDEYPTLYAERLTEAGQALAQAGPEVAALSAPLTRSGQLINQRGNSLLNPVNTGGVSDFNVWYFLIAIVGMWWTVLSNLQSQSYLGSATSGHELRMGHVLAQWRWLGMTLLFMMLVLATFVYTEHPNYISEATQIHADLDRLAERAGGSGSVAEVQAGATVSRQQTIPVAMRYFLPAGVLGLFCALVLGAIISTYDSFMHCWGSVFVQDIVVPFRKRPMNHKEHIWWLRVAIFMVGAFAFFFSWLYPQTQTILMFFAIVNSIWLAPSGAVVLGGLYWKRGTSTAAVTTLIVGVVFGLCGVAAIQLWPIWFDKPFAINAQWLFFYNMMISATLYVTVSLMTKTSTDIESVIHRETQLPLNDQKKPRQLTWFSRVFGITREFSRGDRITAYVIVGWFLFMLAVFFVGTLIGLNYKLTELAWSRFWYVYLGLLFCITLIVTVWFTIGGIKDVVRLFAALKIQAKDYSDDGRVDHEDFEKH